MAGRLVLTAARATASCLGGDHDLPACCACYPRRRAGPAPTGQAWCCGPSHALAGPLGQPEVVYGFGRIDASGRVTVPSRPYVVIRAALRQRCGLRAGDHVLLAAVPDEDMLAAYSFAVVDTALRAHAPVVGAGRRS